MGINYSPELTGIGKYTGEMVEWMASQGHDVRAYYRAAVLPGMESGRALLQLALSLRRRRCDRLALPAVRAEAALDAETFNSSGQLCPEQFLPADGAASLEAGPHHRRGADAVCTPGMRLLGKLSGARTLLHIQDYEVDAMLGLGMAGKGKGGKVAKLASSFERSGLHNVDYVSTISR
ncbi:glycosyltransferase [Escherichia coli]